MFSRLQDFWDTLGETFQPEGDDAPNKNLVATAVLAYILVAVFCASYCLLFFVRLTCGRIIHETVPGWKDSSETDIESSGELDHRGFPMPPKHRREHQREEAIAEDSI